MSRARIVLVGASGHGRVALDAALSENRYEIAGWADTHIEARTVIADYPVLGKPADIARIADEHRLDGFFLGISDNTTRANVYEMIRTAAPRLEYVGIIHPSAVLGRRVDLGPGTLVLAGAVVNTQCRVGIGCIVNTRASLDHDGILHPWCSLLPGVVTGGNVEVGAYSCICLGAVLGHKVHVGEHTFVGAGAVVLADLPPLSLAYGVPARVVRSRHAGERHF